MSLKMVTWLAETCTSSPDIYKLILKYLCAHVGNITEFLQILILKTSANKKG